MTTREGSPPQETVFGLRDVALPVSTPEDIERRALSPNQDDVEQDPTHYAWFRLPRFLHQRQTTFDETEGASISLDLCSAVPLYAELVASLNYRLCELTAKDIIAATTTRLTESVGTERASLSTGHELALTEVWHRLFRNPALGNLLRSMVAETHYRLPADFNPQVHNEPLAAWFTKELHERTLVTEHWDADDGEVEGRWNIDYINRDSGATVLEVIASTAMPSPTALEARAELRRRSLIRKGKLAVDFSSMAWHEAIEALQPQTPDKELHAQTKETVALHEVLDPQLLLDQLGSILTASALAHSWWRPLDVYSADSANLEELLESTVRSFDIDTRQLTLFERGVRRITSPNHIVANVLEEALAFEPESIALITCFEGIPFYQDIPRYGTDEYGELVELYKDFFDRLYNLLKPGGRIVIFPWDTRNHDIDSILFLREIVEYVTNNDPFPEVSTNSYNVRQLKEWMGDTDKNVMLWSPLFKDAEGEPIGEARALDALVVVKPNRQMRFRHGDRGR